MEVNNVIEEIKVEDNLNLVYSLVHKILYPKFKEVYSKEELIQIGTLGLISATNKFDASRGIKFSTYAGKFIIGYVYNYLHADRFLYYRKSKTDSFEKISITYLDAPVSEGKDGGTSCLLDTLAMEYKETSYESIDNYDLFKTAFDHLNDREKNIINLIFIQEKTEHQTAEIMHMSQSYVSRLKHIALNKLKNYIKKEDLIC